MKIKNISYTPSASFTTQGKLSVMLKKYKSAGFGVTELGKGNGNWLIFRKASIILEIEEDGDVIFLDVTEQVKSHYGRSRITSKLVNDFREDMISGKMGLDDF